MTACPGCFKEGTDDAFCRKCRNLLFDGTKVRKILPFSRPAYDEAKLKVTPGRLSISGIQTKISLALKGGQLDMVESGGQYILKPIPQGVFKRLGVVPVNEHLTMQIARQVFKISVAENALVAFQDGEPAYLVRRFDVQPDGTRRLQEDFAQLAQRSAETHGQSYKYEFSYEEIGDLIRKYGSVPRVDLERFFTLVVFNYVVNNGDAHTKNFSLVRSDDTEEYRLTPAYDLLNTRLHLPDESYMALQLFKGEYETESFQANSFPAYDDFVELARRLELKEVRYQRTLQSFIDKQAEVDAMIDRSSLPEDCKTLYKGHVARSVHALKHRFTELKAEGWGQK